MEKTSLVILAAGIGSRYGAGIKQLAEVGAHGEIIMDYGIHDALAAGFDDIVFIIRRDLEEEFRAVIGDRVARLAPVSYAYQELDDLPAGFAVPAGRAKPWGTGHALLATKGIVQHPFCVINADDYYGKEIFGKMHDALSSGMPATQAYMAGFILKNTLSENGGVTRGICKTDADGKLISITETSDIVPLPEAPFAAIETAAGKTPTDGDAYASMNCWGFHPDFLEIVERRFVDFLQESGGEAKSEYLLPSIVDCAMQDGELSVEVLPTRDSWLGITYAVDLPAVQKSFAKMIADGVYPSPLTA